jgi:PIN domain nuclease of toxin-antitoxin system
MNQPLLLDTNVCIWMMDGDLPRAVEDALTETFNTGQSTYVSPITALEVATLARKGRFKSKLAPQRWFENVMKLPGMMLAALPPEVLIESQQLPGYAHKDPADRIIAATAREYGYTVITSDRALLDYGKDGYLSVLEC